jgi:pilus assembly protein CpaF
VTAAASNHVADGTTGAELVDLDEALVARICSQVAQQAGELTELARDATERLAPLHPPHRRASIARAVVARLGGLGRLDRLLADPDVDEVLVNSGCDVWIERRGSLLSAGHLHLDQVEHLVERVLAPLGRRVDRSSPIVDARLPDGSRVCAVLPPVAVDGAALSIRRLATRPRPLAAYTDPAGVALLGDILARRLNVVVSGATSSGKTSFVGALLATLSPQERLVVVEDTTELSIGDHHVLRLEARPATIDGPPPIDLEHLVRTALRLRPDRIVVGEVRGAEVVALVQALNTGHDGSLATCHANGPLDALMRLESLVLQAAPSWPLEAIRRSLTRSIDIVVHVARHDDGRRRVHTVAEVVEQLDGGAPTLRVLAGADACGDLDVVGAPSGRR